MRILLLLILLLGAHWGRGQSRFDLAMELYGKGDSILSLEENGDRKAAIAYITSAKASFESLDSVHWMWQAELHLLDISIKSGDAEKGIANVQQLIARLEDRRASKKLIGRAYYLRGWAEHFLREYGKAEMSFLTSVEYYSSEYAGDYREILPYWFLGYLNYDFGRLDLALKYYETAATLALDYSRVRTRFALLMAKCNAWGSMGNAPRQIDELARLERFLAETPELGDSYWSELYCAMAAAYEGIGDYERGLQYGLRSIEINEDSRGAMEIALSLNGLGRNEEALKWQMKSKVLAQDENMMAVALHNIGASYLNLKKFDSAYHYFAIAENLKRDLTTPERLFTTLQDLGEVLTYLGRHEEASMYFLESIEESPSAHWPIVYWKMSQLHFAKQNMDSAMYFAEASVFHEDGSLAFAQVGLSGARTESLLRRVKWLVELSDIDDLGDSGYSERFIGSAIRLHKYLTSTYTFIQRPQHIIDQSSFLYQEGIRNSLKLAERRDRKWADLTFTFSEWSKVQSLQAAWKGTAARQYGGIPQALLDLERNLQLDENYARSQVQHFEIGGADSSKLAYYKEKLFRLQHSQDSLRNVFETNYPRYHQLRYASDSISVEDVQRHLAANQAFIEYYVGDTVSYVFTISRDHYSVKQIDLVHDSLTFNLRESFKVNAQSQSPTEFQAMALPIYERYIKPAIEELGPEIDELIVVPDGNLSYFPLGALVTSQKEDLNSFQELSYLMDDFTIHYAYSASLYFNEFTSLSDNNDLLAFAPSYETTLQDTVRMRGFGHFRNQITSLAHTLPEVNAISQFFSGQTFVADKASEHNFKSSIGDPGIVHLAMHAIVDDEDPMNSRLLFYNDEDTLEDGFLHAFEIYNMRIPSKMTVLSACETGYGKMAKGEGAMSLARAFAYAGSPSIVMSHWQVDDQSTAELMTHFYRHLSNGKSKGAALRMARQDFLETADISRSHPFFWASFVAVGDDSPLRDDRRLMLLWIAAAIVIFSTTLLVFRRRPKAD